MTRLTELDVEMQLVEKDLKYWFISDAQTSQSGSAEATH